MGIFDTFTGGGFGNSLGQSGVTSGFDKKKRRPQTMAEWQTYIDGLSRPERDQLYPGMHKDLIPATEMITSGDPNWGAAVGTGMPSGVGALEPENTSRVSQQYIWPFGGDEDEAEGGHFNRQTGADGNYGRRIRAGRTHPSYELKISFEPSAWPDRNREYSSRLYLDGVEVGAPSYHEGADGYTVGPGEDQQVELSFSSPDDFFEISGDWAYE